ncbi:phosphoglucosamine mutase [Thermoanaerobacter thermohydrosulfuricus]|uniref:Phosphoglucosamine mutase n=2 Tax=Thermoanaerobacter thermohydrosulfuricus TaxID=1516 RepID=M8CM52_THETY|nr:MULTISPECIES: phosphoglucosamine mutase [Thermoanaerobacter]EMT38285.1 phosphoglucosamine mutase [Thermoanaerobacter thermohydrosulfuricus WC1]SDF69382.1 phosphoglucosamine mutase [Thermoanaerobacter thermohydrosulfuricus]HHW56159.1 phosphoglucosamine mutase [Clostridia bacterium]
MARLFGTDGVRGIANYDLTPQLAFELGRAGAYALTEGSHRPKIVVGKDSRISSDMLECALAAGLTSVGAEVISVGIIPTPAVAYLTRLYQADAGVMISASHNPVEYNGIKFFDKNGYKLPDEVEDRIENIIKEKIELPSPIGTGIGTRKEYTNSHRDYIEFLKSTIDGDLKGMKIVIDCAYGASSTVAPILFKELGAEVILHGAEPIGEKINVNCGSTHPEKLQQLVIENGADIGLAFDGDADRLIAVDEKGNVVDGDHIMAICAIDLKKKGRLKNNTVVATVMSNIGFEIALKEQGINLIRTKVGDRYVLEEMIKGGYSIGGEQSGHIIFLNDNTTGDGEITALKLCSILKESGKKLSELAACMVTYPQVLINAKVKNELKHAYLEDEEIKREIENLEREMRGEGRVLIRPSGTEPLVRVMVEGKDYDKISQMAKELAELIERKLN